MVVAVCAVHRAAALEGCRFAIDEVKVRPLVPESVSRVYIYNNNIICISNKCNII